MPIIWRLLIKSGWWILSKTFSASTEIIIFLIFQFVYMVYHIDWFDILKNSCISRINPAFSWCMRYWCVAELCLLKFCWGFVHLYSSVILTCSFLFVCCLCLVLVSGWWWPHRMSLEVYLPLQFFKTVLEG